MEVATESENYDLVQISLFATLLHVTFLPPTLLVAFSTLHDPPILTDRWGEFALVVEADGAVQPPIHELNFASNSLTVIPNVEVNAATWSPSRPASAK